jgi:hypothetical protein
MPGCCLPSLTAATALHFTAGYLKLSLQQEPTPCFALPFWAAIALCPLEAPGRSSCREKNTPIPHVFKIASLQDAYYTHFLDNNSNIK